MGLIAQLGQVRGTLVAHAAILLEPAPSSITTAPRDSSNATSNEPNIRASARATNALKISPDHLTPILAMIGASVPGAAPGFPWVREVDAQDHQKVANFGGVALINLVDRFSRVKLLSYPRYLGAERVERCSNQADYQMALRLAL